MKLRSTTGSLTLLVLSACLLAAVVVGPSCAPSALGDDASLSSEQAELRALSPYPGELMDMTARPWPDYPVPLTQKDLISQRLDRTKGRLTVTNKTEQRVTVRLLEINDPLVSQSHYMFAGRVLCKDVAGDAYLEMWSTFADGRSYFSRTLGTDPTAPMGKLTGNSQGFRPFILPFDAAGAGGQVESIQINVVLPGSGSVTLQEGCLFGFGTPGKAAAVVAAAKTQPNGRLPNQAAFQTAPFVALPRWASTGLVLASALLVLMTVTLAVLMGQPHRRGWVLTTAPALSAVGFVLAGMGLAGALSNWTTSLSLTLLLAGSAVGMVCGLGSRYLRQAFHHAEWRRMAALDT